MFESLNATTPPSRRPRLPWLVSLLAHLALISGGIVLTRNIAVARRPISDTRTPLVFAAPNRLRAPTSAPSVGGPPRVDAPPVALQAPVALPTVGITIDPVPHAEPDRGGDRTTPGRIPPGVVPMEHLPVLRGQPGTDRLAVDQPAIPLAGPRPAYPPGLRVAGIEGSVRLRFVVTATGSVDALSVRLVGASDSAFVTPAITAILAWRFTPARRRGAAVAQQVEQVVRFRLER